MKRRRLLLCAGGLVLTAVALALVFAPRSTSASAPGAKADAPPKIATSRITHVTIYPDSALVTREVDVPAGSGNMELVVSPLPDATIVSSLYSESSDDVRVLTTRFRSRPVREDTREEVRRVEDEIKKVQLLNQKVASDISALQANMAFLAKLENFSTTSTTHATEKGKLDSEATIQLAKYLMENRTDKSKAMTDLQQKKQELDEQLQFASRKLRDLTGGVSRTERDAVLLIDRVGGGATKVKLNYLVSGATWRPQYKFRAGAKTSDAVKVEYLAAVTQHTGEDWSRVALTLSTAQPLLHAAPPDLTTLAVAVVRPGAPMPGVSLPTVATGGFGGRPGEIPAPFTNPALGAGKFTADKELQKLAAGLRTRAQNDLNERREGTANTIQNYAAALDQARDLVLAGDVKRGESKPAGTRERRTEGPSVTYHLPSKMSVPSRNDEQVLEVAKIDFVPDYFYKAIPVLSSHVFRQANLLNKSKHVLLPGEATMYQGSDFVGRMSIPLVAVGEDLTVGFGTEPQLQVKREMLEKTKSMQGGNQVHKFEYRILLSSFKSEKVKVQLWDRLPHGENESLNVVMVKASPEISKDALYLREERPTNLLRWDLEVTPEMRGEKAQAIQYEFRLEFDRQANIGSFGTR